MTSVNRECIRCTLVKTVIWTITFYWNILHHVFSDLLLLRLQISGLRLVSDGRTWAHIALSTQRLAIQTVTYLHDRGNWEKMYRPVSETTSANESLYLNCYCSSDDIAQHWCCCCWCDFDRLQRSAAQPGSGYATVLVVYCDWFYRLVRCSLQLQSITCDSQHSTAQQAGRR